MATDSAANVGTAAAHRRHSSCGPVSQQGWRAQVLVCMVFAHLVQLAGGAITYATSAGITNYTERGPPVAIDPAFSLSTNSSDQLSKVVVKVTTPEVSTLDELEFPALRDGLGASEYDPIEKTIMLLGTATTQTYQEILRQLTFFNPSSTPEISNRQVVFQVFDANGALVSSASNTKVVHIVTVDDTPTISLSLTSRVYTEGDGEVAVDSSLGLADPDTDELNSVSVQIGAGYEQGKDRLLLGGALDSGLDSAWNATTGTLTVFGLATKPVYQAVLRGVKFVNSDVNLTPGNRTITFRATDQTSTSAGSSIVFVVVAVNQGPVITLSKSVLAFQESQTAGTAVDSSITVIDVDTPNLLNGTVAVTAGYVAGIDKLSIPNNPAWSSLITTSWNNDTGVLTLTGAAPPSVYQAALRAVIYQNFAETTQPNRTITFGATDGLLSTSVALPVTVEEVNDLPEIQLDTTGVVFAGSLMTLQPTLNITDRDSRNLSAASVTISNNCDPQVDSLLLAVPAEELQVSPSGCVLTLEGNQPVSVYVDVLRTVQLRVSGVSDMVQRTVTFVVNDGIDSSLPADYIVYTTDSMQRPVVSSITTAPTAGGLVTVTGLNFGPIQPMVVSLVSIGTSSCTNVTVTKDYTEFTCIVAPGVGTGLAVDVSVSSQVSEVVTIFDYEPPTITAISAGRTAGDYVNITGTNFGPLGSRNLVAATDGNVTVNGAPCGTLTDPPEVIVAHTVIRCKTVEGTGSGHDAELYVKGQGTGTTGIGLFSYAPPSFPSVSRASFLGNLAGYEALLDGDNFGPAGTPANVYLTFGTGNDTQQCSNAVAVSHMQLQCIMVAATDNGAYNTSDWENIKYNLHATVDGLTSTDGAEKFAYEGPVITGIDSGSFVDLGPWGEQVYINGRNFGPQNKPMTIDFSSGGHTMTLSNLNYPTNTRCAGGPGRTAVVCPPKTLSNNVQGCTFVPPAEKVSGQDCSGQPPSCSPGLTGYTLTIKIKDANGFEKSSNAFAYQYEQPYFTGQGSSVYQFGYQFGEYGGSGITWNVALAATTCSPDTAPLDPTFFVTTQLTSYSVDGTEVTGYTGAITSGTVTVDKTHASASNPVANGPSDPLPVELTLNGIPVLNGAGRLAFHLPKVTAVSPSHYTPGGAITITGSGLGRLSSPTNWLTSTEYRDDTGIKVCADAACTSYTPCTNAVVTVESATSDEQEAECVLGEGVHIGAKVSVVTGKLSSDADGDGVTYTNLVPQIDPPGTNFGPYNLYGTGATDGVPGAGSTITVYGRGFGPPGAELEVEARVPPERGTSVLPCSSATQVADANHGVLTCRMPPGYGIDFYLYVAVKQGDAKLETVASCDSGTCSLALDDGYAGCDDICLKYKAPIITSVSSAPTTGGLVTVTGTNFGPPVSGDSSHVESLLLNSLAATNRTVLDDSTIVANYDFAGTGTGYTAEIRIGAQGDTFANLFSYMPPNIEAITASPAWNTVPGSTDKLVFTGTNFGNDPGSSTVTVTGADGERSCAPVVAESTHTVMACTLTCTTPCDVSLERNINITVDGQSSSLGGLFLEGPKINAVSMISMFGSDVPSNQLTITGEHFGSGTDGTGKVISVETCRFTHASQCEPTDWITQSNPSHDVASPATQIIADIAPAYGRNFTVRATFSGSDGTNPPVEAVATGGDGLLNFHQPRLFDGTDGYVMTVSDMSDYNFPTDVDVNNTDHKMVLKGAYFGKTSLNRIASIVWNGDPSILTLANSQWSVDVDASEPGLEVEMSFYPPDGVGTANFSVTFSCDGLPSSDCTATTNYVTVARDAPRVTKVTPVGAAGGPVTITGTNFGPLGSANLANGTGVVFEEEVPCYSPEVTVAHTEIVCTVPPGVGFGLTPGITVAGVTSEAVSDFLNYDGPIITNVTSPPTDVMSANSTGPFLNVSGTIIDASPPAQGVWLTITGANFGPPGPFYGSFADRNQDEPVEGIVYIGTEQSPQSVGCEPAYVTVHNTEIQCLLSTQGAGANYSVLVTILGQDTFGSAAGLSGYVGNGGGGLNALSYQPPSISSVNSVSFLGGSVITLTGTNFGPGRSTVLGTTVLPPTWQTGDEFPTADVKVGVFNATNCTITIDHREIQCLAPAYIGQPSIRNLPLSLDIEGQTATHTYSYLGPNITSVTPVSFFGGRVTVTGQSFGTQPGDIESIIVGGEVQELSFALPSIPVADTQIVFNVKPSTIGEAKDLLITIKGVNTGATGVRSVLFQGPKVFSASGGNTAGGLITITGANFGPPGTANIQRVSIADKLCSNPTVTTTSTMTCNVEPGTGSGYDISITVGGVSGIGSGNFSYARPVVTSVDPMNPPPGSRVTLLGRNFGQFSALVTVNISGIPCTDIRMVTPHTALSCITPLDTGGDHELLVLVDGLLSDSGTYTYAYPNVTSVPSIDPSGGNVTIYGENFGPVGSALFPAQGVLLGDTQCYFPYVVEYGVRISCVVDSAVTRNNGGQWNPEYLCCDGLMPVTVTLDGLTSVKEDMFSFKQPELYSFSPMFGRSRDRIKLTGRYFGVQMSQLRVTINGREVTRYSSFTASGQRSSNNSLEVEVPPGSGGNLTVQLYMSDREATYEFMEHDNNFTYLGPTFDLPEFRTSVPAPTLGGLTTIAGNNLGALNSSSHIDYINLTDPRTGQVQQCINPVVTVDDLEVTCTVGPGIGGGWDISMSILGQPDDGSGAGMWQYRNPSVSRVSPRRASPGTTIFVEGEDFGMEAKHINISVVGPGDSEGCLGVTCRLSRLSVPHKQVVCVVPESAGEDLDIIVEVAGLRSNATDASDFSYQNPIVSSVSPAPTQGGAITIFGQGFGPAGECYKPYIDAIEVGGNLCTDALVLRSTALTCVAPPGIGSGYDAVVTLRGSSSRNTGFGLFRYGNPNITSVVPPPTVGGDLIINGQNFGPETVDGGTPPLVQVWREQEEVVFGQLQLVRTEKVVTDCDVTLAHSVIQCTVSEGIGANYSANVTVAGQGSLNSGLLQVSYASPIVDSVSPQIQSEVGPTTITITGRNFGSPSYIQEIRVFVDTYEVDRTTLRLWDLRTADNKFELTGLAPPGAGINLPLYVHVGGLVNEPNHVNGWFSYTSPAIVSVNPVPTQGGIATITGVNFGPLNTEVHSVMLGAVPCTDPRVTVRDTEIQCLAPPGVGGAIDVRLKINTDAASDSLDSGRGKFRYRCPLITAVSYTPPPSVCADGRCAEGPTGQKVTIYGNNFGGNLSSIHVGLLSPETSDEALRAAEYVLWDMLDLEYHPDVPEQPDANGLYTLRAGVPVGYARERLVVITVGNQDNVMRCEQPLDVDELIETPGRFSQMMYSYTRPDILSATSAPTAGGRITIFGRSFGPVGRAGVSRVLVESWHAPSRQILCENFNVTVSNVALECDLGAGEGGQLNVWMMVGGQQSGLVRVYSYLPPKLLAVNPSSVEPGMFVTLSGENLGSDASLIAVDVYDAFGRMLFAAPSANITLTTPHSQILLPVPFGAGVQRSFVVKLPAPVGITVPPRNIQSSRNDPEAELFFSYLAPVISRVSPAPTSGGTVTITGSGFGSARDDRLSVQTVLLGSDVCTNPNVTVDGVEFTCEMSPGSGGGYDAFVTVDGQDSEFTFNAFSYAAPRIDSLTPALASGGSIITMAGANFGIDTSEIEVRLGGEECSEVFLQELHTLMTCRVPLGVSGRDVEVVVTVNEVANNASATPTFTYSFLGCINPIAENYNSAATEDDGSCIIAGCTDRDAANFNPIANLADDSCIREDGLIRLLFDLDYDVYLGNTTRYNALVLEYLALNLGLPVGTLRLEVRDAQPGSTLFTIAILDDPEATGARNDELAAQLQRLVVANQWAHDKVELGSLLEVVMPDGARIVTKDNEPRVSVGSIVGIVIGGVTLLLWAVFWRRILRWCAGKCGSGADEKDDLVEASIYNNSLYRQTPPSSGGTRMPASLQPPTNSPYGGGQIVPYGGGQYVKLDKDSK